MQCALCNIIWNFHHLRLYNLQCAPSVQFEIFVRHIIFNAHHIILCRVQTKSLLPVRWMPPGNIFKRHNLNQSKHLNLTQYWQIQRFAPILTKYWQIYQIWTNLTKPWIFQSQYCMASSPPSPTFGRLGSSFGRSTALGCSPIMATQTQR